MQNIKEQKKIIRKNSLEYRKKLDNQEYNIICGKIQERLKNDEILKKAKAVLCYVSKDNTEVSTYEIINFAFSSGKLLYLPKCNIESHTMTFYNINSFSDLKKGYFDILEPDEKRCKAVKFFSSNDICIVPALAFDNFGYRVGWGGGYYDRFLSEFCGRKIGICFSKNIINEIPHENTDIRIERVFTENSTINFI